VGNGSVIDDIQPERCAKRDECALMSENPSSLSGSQLVYFCVVLVAFLFPCLMLVFPNTEGDPDYIGMTISFFNHLTPDLREEDIALTKVIEEKNNINSPENSLVSDWWFPTTEALINHSSNLRPNPNCEGYYISLRENNYAYHFWLYPLLNLPAFAFLHYFKLNELRSFQLTNLLFLILAICSLIYVSSLTYFQKIWMILLMAFNSILFYLNWYSPEVFVYSLVVISIAFFLNKKYSLAVLASSLASLQSLPIIVFTFYLIASGWKASGMRLKELITLLIFSSISFVYYIFYYINFGVTSLMNTGRWADFSNISLDKIFGLFFDLNSGIIYAFPIITIISTFALVASITRKNLFVPSLWAVLIIMAALFSTTINWNHSAVNISRYGIVMAPIIILISVLEIPFFSRKVINIILCASLILSFILFGSFVGHSLVDDSEIKGNAYSLNSISKIVLITAPSFYNPPKAEFVERALGIEYELTTIQFDQRLNDEIFPIILTYQGIPRKVLTDYKGLGLVEKFTGCQINKEEYEAFKKNKLIYINFEYELFKFPFSGSEFIIYDRSAIEKRESALG
jgi:hypothetical protein